MQRAGRAGGEAPVGAGRGRGAQRGTRTSATAPGYGATCAPSSPADRPRADTPAEPRRRAAPARQRARSSPVPAARRTRSRARGARARAADSRAGAGDAQAAPAATHVAADVALTRDEGGAAVPEGTPSVVGRRKPGGSCDAARRLSAACLRDSSPGALDGWTSAGGRTMDARGRSSMHARAADARMIMRPTLRLAVAAAASSLVAASAAARLAASAAATARRSTTGCRSATARGRRGDHHRHVDRRPQGDRRRRDRLVGDAHRHRDRAHGEDQGHHPVAARRTRRTSRAALTLHAPDGTRSCCCQLASGRREPRGHDLHRRRAEHLRRPAAVSPARSPRRSDLAQLYGEDDRRRLAARDHRRRRRRCRGR